MFKKDYEKMKEELKKRVVEELKLEFSKELKDEDDKIKAFYYDFITNTKKKIAEIIIDLFVKEEALFEFRSYCYNEKLSFEKCFSKRLKHFSEHATKETKRQLLEEVQPKIDYINSEEFLDKVVDRILKKQIK